MLELEKSSINKYLEKINEKARKYSEKKMSMQEFYDLANKHLMHGARTRDVSSMEKGIAYAINCLALHKKKEDDDD